MPRTDKANIRKTACKSVLPMLVILYSVCLLCGRLFFINKMFYLVGSSSMEPEYPVGTLVVAKKTPLKNIGLGEVIVFKSEALDGGLAFHRVIRITDEGVYTKGDMNRHEDNQLVAAKNYVAKEIFKSYAVGRVLLILKNPLGFILFLVLPCLAFVLLYKTLKRMKT